MPDLLERLYQRTDLPALRRLWSKVYEAESVERREAVFRWIGERNPLTPDGAPRHLILQGDAIVGSLGCLPVKYQLDREEYMFHFSHDLLVDPEARGLGLGKKLVKRIASNAPGMAGGLWMTGPCYALHQRTGWDSVEPFHGHALPMDAGALLQRRIKSPLAAAILAPFAGMWLKMAARKRPKPSLPIVEIQRFDSGVNHLFTRAAPRLGLIARRTQEYLNWKYVDTPLLEYRKLLVGDPRNPVAYAVTRLQKRPDGHLNGLIVDLLADPDCPGAFDTAIMAASTQLGRQGAEVVYFLTTHAPFRSRLNEIGFRQAPALHTFVIYGQEQVKDKGDPTKSSFWYLTYGDSDGDMWAEAQSWKTARDDGPRASRTSGR